MQTKLLKGLDNKGQADAKANFYDARPFRIDLERVLQAELDSLHGSLRNEKIYEDAGWSAKMADTLGQIKATKRILDMIKLDKDGK